MKKIIFFSSWETPKNLLERYKLLTPKNDGVWLNIEGTCDAESADYIIILDPLKELNEKYNNKVKILIQREPEYVSPIEKINDTIADKYCCYKDGYYLFSTWWIGKPFCEIENLPYNKTKNISAITSGKNHLDGHKKRINFIKNISREFGFVDIFGKNLIEKDFKSGFKGELIEKLDGLYDYKYSFAIENGVRKNYFSEKICDCFLTMTKPLYYGCPNIEDFFPKESLENIDINSENFKEQCINIIDSEINIKQIKEAKYLVMYKYNLWPSIKSVIDGL